MKIKTYPLHFTDEELRQIEKIAGKGNIKKFIYDAIEEKKKRYDKRY
jgi:hypothetical protein